MDIISPTYEINGHKIYVIPGNPTPLARARFSFKNNEPRVYDSQKNTKLVTGIHLTNQHGDHPPYEGPLLLNATFYFPIPLKYKNKILPGHPYTSVPDLTNILKYIEDICQDVHFFKNDSQITQIISRKQYDNQTRTEFYFIELDKIKEK